MKTRTAIPYLFALAVLTALAGYATAQPVYPNTQIRIIVSYAPGNSLDVLARLVGQKLTGTLGQQVVVDNRPGGNTVIGSETLVKAAPDGYTLLLVVNTHVIIPHLYDKLPFDAIKDFAPVATLARTELVLVLHPSVPADNLQEFIALAKARPGQLNYASAGSGGPAHLAAELFNMMTGITMLHIPYKGAGPALTELLGGQVQVFLAAPIVAIPHIKNGKLKAIAISGESRLATLPQVPTFTQAGLPGYDVKVWFGILAPAATPKAIVDRLASEFASVMAMPDFKDSLASQGMEPFISTPEQFGALIKTDMSKYAKVIKTANIKLD